MGHSAGLGGKANPSHKWRVSARDNTTLKVRPLLHNGSVRLDFMTDDVNEAEEMRIQTVVSDCAAEIRNLNESGWVAVRGGRCQTRLMEVPNYDDCSGV